jgi:hypothetical protein
VGRKSAELPGNPTFPVPEHKGGDESGHSRGYVDHVAPGEIEDAIFEEQPVSVPHGVSEGAVYSEKPERDEQNCRPKLHSVGKTSTCESARDDGEAQLIHAIDTFGDSGSL